MSTSFLACFAVLQQGNSQNSRTAYAKHVDIVDSACTVVAK